MLVDFLTNGNEQAFKTILARYHQKVCRLAASIIGPSLAMESEDVAQEVFLKVLAGLSRFRNDARFCTWLYRITFNTSVSYKQRNSHRITSIAIDLKNLESKEVHPSRQMEISLSRDLLNQAIDQLPIEYQSAIRLFYWYQLPIAEISEQLGVRENTIKSYLHRARKLLSVRLSKYKDEQ